MATFGLNLENLPTLRWKWTPIQPVPIHIALPKSLYRDDSLFFAATPPQSEEVTYRFSFPQLARQTSDLRFYRLLQILNTPLSCLDSRDMGRSDFAYWEGVRPQVDMRHGHIYFWFFRDLNDDDLIVAEYGFDGSFTLRSEKKTSTQLASFYSEVCSFVCKI
jgi:hypothetical protein